MILIVDLKWELIGVLYIFVGVEFLKSKRGGWVGALEDGKLGTWRDPGKESRRLHGSI